jgi:hypothetical protein
MLHTIDTVGTPTIERAVAGVRSRLGRIRRVVSREPEASGELGLPCSVCGAPAIGWSFDSSVRGGVQVIDGTPVCADHGAEPGELTRSKAG